MVILHWLFCDVQTGWGVDCIFFSGKSRCLSRTVFEPMRANLMCKRIAILYTKAGSLCLIPISHSIAGEILEKERLSGPRV